MTYVFNILAHTSGRDAASTKDLHGIPSSFLSIGSRETLQERNLPMIDVRNTEISIFMC